MRIKKVHEDKLGVHEETHIDIHKELPGRTEAEDVLLFRKGPTRGTGIPRGL